MNARMITALVVSCLVSGAWAFYEALTSHLVLNFGNPGSIGGELGTLAGIAAIPAILIGLVVCGLFIAPRRPDLMAPAFGIVLAATIAFALLPTGLRAMAIYAGTHGAAGDRNTIIEAYNQRSDANGAEYDKARKASGIDEVLGAGFLARPGAVAEGRARVVRARAALDSYYGGQEAALRSAEAAVAARDRRHHGRPQQLKLAGEIAGFAQDRRSSWSQVRAADQAILDATDARLVLLEKRRGHWTVDRARGGVVWESDADLAIAKVLAEKLQRLEEARLALEKRLDPGAPGTSP
jgi:hypothetical protein